MMEGASRWIGMRGVALALFGSALAFVPAAGQEQITGSPQARPEPPTYRALGARHLYDTYGDRVYKGRLPPLLYAIAVVETEVDEEGRVVDAVITREPAAAKEVGAWIVALIKQASPFPKPGNGGHARYQDVWLVDRTYTFQLHTLTEGQR
jgi:protein TonB